MKRITNVFVVLGLSVGFLMLFTTSASATCHFVNFSQSSYSVDEGAGSVQVTIKREIIGAGCTAKLDYSTGNDSAVAPSDFTAVSGSHQFTNPTDATFSFSVPIANDQAVEGNEIFRVNFTHDPDDAQGTATGSATVTIQDNDQAAPPPPPPAQSPKPRTSPPPASPAAPVAIPPPSPSPTTSPSPSHSPSPTPLAKAQDRGGFPVIGIVAIAAVLVAAGAGGWLYWLRRKAT